MIRAIHPSSMNETMRERFVFYCEMCDAEYQTEKKVTNFIFANEENDLMFFEVKYNGIICIETLSIFVEPKELEMDINRN